MNGKNSLHADTSDIQEQANYLVDPVFENLKQSELCIWMG